MHRHLRDSTLVCRLPLCPFLGADTEETTRIHRKAFMGPADTTAVTDTLEPLAKSVFGRVFA